MVYERESLRCRRCRRRMTYVIDKGRNGNGNHPRQWHGSILVRNMIEWPRCDMPPDILRRARAYDADRPHHPLLRTWEVMLDIDKRTIQGRVPEELWPVPNGNHNHADEGPSVGTKSGTSALDEIHTLFDKWLALSDSPARYDQIDIVLAVIVANRLPSDP